MTNVFESAVEKLLKLLMNWTKNQQGTFQVINSFGPLGILLPTDADHN